MFSLPFKLHGFAVRSTFHPSRSIFFVYTKKSVQLYDLLKTEIIEKLDTGLCEASTIVVHSGGPMSDYDDPLAMCNSFLLGNNPLRIVGEEAKGSDGASTQTSHPESHEFGPNGGVVALAGCLDRQRFVPCFGTGRQSSRIRLHLGAIIEKISHVEGVRLDITIALPLYHPHVDESGGVYGLRLEEPNIFSISTPLIFS
ncbi:hypothetical protein Fmac_024989 [Flemingia macrophylla]|uniref:Uncharacterized protein n=1 Tax=Flemingia macrophylla TaxID=520843 RepID=A0ABD1LQY8_9FABA